MNYSAALIYFPKITYRRASKIFNHFPKLEKVFEAELDELIKAGLEENIANEFISWREIFSVEKISADLEKNGVKTVSLMDKNYPQLLKEINDPPPVLFYRGVLPKNDQPAVSVVGTRRCTSYGQRMTKEISGDLAKQNVAIVSGLALGIDGTAHEATLDNKGITYAVLGSGVDARGVYPAAHQPLAERIIQSGGAVISEYPPGFKPTLYSFPARNRIIAGMSLGTIVTEAPIESGALITGARALDYNRDVFAVPHPAGSEKGAGCNALIKRGAILVENASEILEFLKIREIPTEKSMPKNVPANRTEELIFLQLKEGGKHIDELIKGTGLPSAQLTSYLTILEMRGKVQNTGGMMYILK